MNQGGNAMADTSRGLIDRGKPWRPDVKWPVVAIEAVILVAIGAFMLVSTDRAGEWLLQLIGVVFLLGSLQVAWESFRGDPDRVVAFDSFRAGIGVAVGVIATSIWWSDYVSNNAMRLILGWGLIAFAVLQILGLVTAEGRAGLRVATLGLSALTLILGVLLLTSNESSAGDRIRFLGVVLLVFGVLLGGLAYLIRSQTTSTSDNAMEA